jgi:hypothetical protein
MARRAPFTPYWMADLIALPLSGQAQKTKTEFPPHHRVEKFRQLHSVLYLQSHRLFNEPVTIACSPWEFKGKVEAHVARCPRSVAPPVLPQQALRQNDDARRDRSIAPGAAKCTHLRSERRAYLARRSRPALRAPS